MSVTTFTANENVNWSLFGGVDQGVFRIDHSSGALSFDRASDYESPQDSGADNTYVVAVRTTDDSENKADQTVTVNVEMSMKLSISSPAPSPASDQKMMDLHSSLMLMTI